MDDESRMRNIPMVATSMYPPLEDAMNKSTPTPLSTILLAVFFQPGCSVWKSFFSVSIPCSLPSSLMKRLPGPHVGNAESEQMILPPVARSAESAESSVGNKAGSGFLTSENSAGSRWRRQIIIDLTTVSFVCHQHSVRPQTSIHRGQQRAHHSLKVRKGPRHRA